MARANYLATQFGPNEERWPTPTAMYARTPEKGKFVVREIELLVPLSEKTSVPIMWEGWDIAHKRELALELFGEMRRGEICDGLVLISWKHENIPKLARQMGCGPAEGCPERYPGTTFDQVWNIRYTYDQSEHKERKKGAMLPPHWSIQGTVLQENFDPVAWKKVGGQVDIGGEY